VQESCRQQADFELKFCLNGVLSPHFSPESCQHPITKDLAWVEDQGGKDRKGINLGKGDGPNGNGDWQGLLRANNSQGAAGRFLQAKKISGTCVSSSQKEQMNYHRWKEQRAKMAWGQLP
jgi:hypothetical protein